MTVRHLLYCTAATGGGAPVSAVQARAASLYGVPQRTAGEGSGLPVRRQRVRVPWRLVSSPRCQDVALPVQVKVAALAARPEGCRAKTSMIASYPGMPVASADRGMKPTALSRPGRCGGAAFAASYAAGRQGTAGAADGRADDAHGGVRVAAIRRALKPRSNERGKQERGLRPAVVRRAAAGHERAELRRAEAGAPASGAGEQTTSSCGRLPVRRAVSCVRA
jgi:hypothetical protein